jgi:cellobiose-specific phosphotransferase system component IIC
MSFADYSLPLILAVSIAVLVGAIEIGHWFGVLARPGGRGSVSTLKSSILGLLALMIGFTFAVALSRFEARVREF